ncbi:MAG: alpha/beta fold hydrolase [Cyanobacteria bacterium P01_F01_bin.150]
MHEFSTLVELLRYRAQHDPHKTVFTFLRDGEIEAEVLTYLELDRRARAIAAKLQSIGAEGQRALLLYSPNLTFITAFLGCLYAKVLAVPAYPPRPNATMKRLRSMMTDAGATVALTTQQLLGNFGKLLDNNPDFANLNWVTTEGLTQEPTIDGWASSWKPSSISPNALAFLQYTSGSTGLPKGVMVSHGNLIHNAKAIQERFNDTSRSLVVSWLPPYHDMGLIGGILQPVYFNMPGVLMAPVSFLQRPFRWLQAISSYRGTTSGGPNFAYDLCLRQVTPEQRDTLDLSNWSLAFSGAEPVRAETIRQFTEYFGPCGFRPEAFYPCYGMAEATLFVSGCDRTQTPTCTIVDGAALEQNTVVPSEPDSQQAAIQAAIRADNEEGIDRRQLVGCGIPSTSQHIRIVDPSTLEPCPDLAVGEIWVSGPNVAQGYWNRPQQTAETFQAKILATGEGPFLRTGDLGFIKDEELYVTGRLKDLIVIRGLNHYPQDIEATVGEAHEQIRSGQGAAFSVDVKNEDGVREERLVIVQEVKRTALRRLKTGEIVTAIRQAVSQHHALQTYAVVLLKTGNVPKTSSGKIQRHACKRGFLDNSLKVVGQWREGELKAEGRRQKAEGVGEIPSKIQNLKSKIQNPLNDALRLSINTSNEARRRLRIPQAGAIASIQTWLINQVARMLKVTPDMIDIHEPLARYGLDSIAAVRLSGALEDWLGRSLSPTLAYDYPSIAALSKYLSAEPDALATEAELVRQSSQYKRRISDEAIAIVGMGCRFPGANNPEEFWQLLREGRDAITVLDEGDRWSGHRSAKVGGFLSQRVDEFDPQFFGISPREANRMDPQQRLLLEVSWEALEQAGIAPTHLAGTSTGVFVGISSSDYSHLQAREMTTDPYSGTGNAHSIAANRLSYVLDLRGPSLTVDTACSSSLVALHNATRSLQNGECDQAIAAGVNLILSPDLTLTFADAGMLAADGRCKTFSAAADGYVRGEGCGVVILKRLSDAQRDGDSVLAVVKGAAVNQDGRSNGLTAPNGLAQQAVIQAALQRADVSAIDIQYVDAHGTGTVLGDPIELNALKAVLSQGRESNQRCWIGSVKTNIGHLEAAAGMASLIKVILALQHSELPPHLHVQELNPHVSWEDGPLTVVSNRQEWSRLDSPRLAGISSFGFGGTNAHVIVSEGPVANNSDKHDADSAKENSQTAGLRALTQPPPLSASHYLLTLSAKTPNALADLTQSYSDFLNRYPDESLANICATAHLGRSHFPHRLAIIAQSNDDLGKQLQLYKKQEPSGTRISNEINPGGALSKLAFLFTGQGSQYPNMGYDLYQSQPVFRRVIDECDRILQTHLEYPLLHVLYPEERRKKSHERPLPEGLIHQTRYTQPILFAVEYALAELWQSWGIYPDVVMGHSVGEYVAACVAGILSLEDGLRLIAARSRLMQNLPANGAMVAVFTSAQQVTSIIEAYAQTNGSVAVDIAAVNGPENTVISGEKGAIATVTNVFKAQGITTKPLNVSHAFHSSLMAPILSSFEAISQTITFHPPQLPIVSNVTGTLYASSTEETTLETGTNNGSANPMCSHTYWSRHIRQAVQFAPSMETLFKSGYSTFLEVGPKPTLLTMAQRCQVKAEGRRQKAESSANSPTPQLPNSPTPQLPNSPNQWLHSLRPNQPDWSVLLKTAAQLYTSGHPLNWNGIAAGQSVQRIHHLPTYPWQKQRFWFAPQWDVQPWDVQPLTNGLTSSEQASVASSSDLLYGLEWRSQPRQANAAKLDRSGTWIIATMDGQPSALAAQIAHRLDEQGQKQLTVEIGDRPAEALADHLGTIEGNIDRVLLVASDNANKNSPNLFQPCQAALTLVQSLVQLSQGDRQSLRNSDPYPNLWIITQNSVLIDDPSSQGLLNSNEVTPEAELSGITLAQSTLWGLGKVVALEHPDLWGGLLDVEVSHNQPPSVEDKVITAIIDDCSDSDGESAIAFHHNQRYVQRLTSLSPLSQKQELDTTEPSIAPPTKGELKGNSSQSKMLQDTYLITGGLGSLGLTIAQWLFEQHGMTHLTLVGRRQPSEAAQKAIAQLQNQGATIHTAQADIAQSNEVANLLQQLQSQGLNLKGIIHGAGVLQDGVLQSQTWDNFATVLAPKVNGAWNLHQLTQSYDLDCFVLFSSVASLLGSPGQGNYAAANGFMDTLAQYRQHQGLPALSINWGPWAQGGMASSVGDALQERLTRNGFNLLEPEQALTTLSNLMFGDPQSSLPAQVGVADIDWTQMGKRLTTAQRTFLSPVLENRNRSFESIVDSTIDGTSSMGVSRLIDTVLAVAVGDRSTFFATYLQQQISQVLQLPENTLSGDSNLMDVGMDSLMVMESINQLRQDFSLMLYPREFYEHPTIGTLSAYLAQEFNRMYSEDSFQTPESTKGLPLVIPTLQGISDAVTLHQVKRLPPAVFILSSPRSGSTLLRVMLAGHSRLFAAPELHLLPFDRMAERQEQLGESHLSEGLERSLMDLNRWDSETSRIHVQQWLDQNAPTADVYAAIQSMAQGRTLVDKSPTYAMHRATLDRAEAIFQNAKYIHLVRHPYSVMESFARMRMDKLLGIPATNPYGLAERIWSQSNQNILDFASTIDANRLHLLQYEDLVRDPAATLKQLCQFLGIDLEDSLLNPYEGDRMTDGVYEKSLSLGDPNFLLHQKIDSSLADAWKTIDLPHRLGEQGQAIAQTFRYKLPQDSLTTNHSLASDSLANETFQDSQNLTVQKDDALGFLVSTQPTSAISAELLEALAPTEHTVTLNGLTHKICIWGDQDAPPVVCIHGVLDQGYIWHPVAQSLVQQGYRVIAPDLRGHGQSSHVGPGGSYHLLDFLSDIDAVIDWLYPTLKAEGRRQKAEIKAEDGTPQLPNSPTPQLPNSLTLVGHSMGSIIAALYASSRTERVRSLVMVETILPAEKRAEVRDQLTTLLDAHSQTPDHPIFPDIETAARRLRQGTPSLPEDFSMALADRICKAADGKDGIQWAWDPKLRNRTGIGFSRMPFGRSDYLKLLSELSVPVTLVYGDRSTFNRPADLEAQANALSQAQRVVLSGGHNIHIDAFLDLGKLIGTQF